MYLLRESCCFFISFRSFQLTYKRCAAEVYGEITHVINHIIRSVRPEPTPHFIPGLRHRMSYIIQDLVNVANAIILYNGELDSLSVDNKMYILRLRTSILASKWVIIGHINAMGNTQ